MQAKKLYQVETTKISTVRPMGEDGKPKMEGSYHTVTNLSVITDAPPVNRPGFPSAPSPSCHLSFSRSPCHRRICTRKSQLRATNSELGLELHASFHCREGSIPKVLLNCFIKIISIVRGWFAFKERRPFSVARRRNRYRRREEERRT